MRRLVHAVNAGLLLLLFAGSLWVYPALPDQIPRHFGLAGGVDAYWQATLVHWMLLPVVALGVTAVIYGCAWIVGKNPSSVNVPNQQRYDALDPTDKRRVVRLRTEPVSSALEMPPPGTCPSA